MLQHITCYMLCVRMIHFLLPLLLLCFRSIILSSYIFIFIWNFSPPLYHFITYSLISIQFIYFCLLNVQLHSRNGQSSEGHRHASCPSLRGRHFLHYVQQRKSRHILHSGNQINKWMSGWVNEWIGMLLFIIWSNEKTGYLRDY